MRYRISMGILIAASLIACDEPKEKTHITEDRPKPTTTIINVEKTKPIPTAKPLDLTLPETQSLATSADEHFTEKNSLPNLFKKQKKDKKVSLNGKLLQDKNNPDYVNSIEGAELSIEMKTK